MIDIHSHILPGLDDGPESMTSAVEMARKAVEQGITGMIATPHHQNGTYENHYEDILAAVHRFEDELRAHKIDLHIAPGQEVRLYGNIVADAAHSQLITLNQTNHLLIELPSDHVPSYTARYLYELQLQGIKPVIAHPERNREIAADSSKLYELIKNGALAQVTASSVAGRFGRNVKKLSMQLIEHELVHFVASDTHNNTNRPNELAKSFDVIEKEFGMGAVYTLKENAEILVSGGSVYAGPPSRIKKKKILGLF
ncbi:capsular polysaccharide biosynthesis [Alkalihalophilus pseudofirmus OF4]|uniref:Tyrosine-protein phosphatase n=1 Tax=Alkalihalophilus pseudofirmus (strain ATCC BAA-2126 / JCM 17055 / OF4) TaxID=398511 RepID=D3G0A7_ALKPO|nr:CpsB/CapC family capsule biosynthesis tyrosine phosphatase [Alkalihalophilus pseudofirmus]ADC49382.1 capsular polysaccharide biosynthesis [Alkalihalophilus pseudofirmus OF4]